MQQQLQILIHAFGFSHGQWYVIMVGFIWIVSLFGLALLIHVLHQFKTSDLENFLGVLMLAAMLSMLFFTFVATPSQADVRHNQRITNQISQLQTQLTTAEKQKAIQQILMEKSNSKATIDKYASRYITAKQDVAHLQQKINQLQRQKVVKLFNDNGKPNPNWHL